jgi:hypothetical protein
MEKNFFISAPPANYVALRALILGRMMGHRVYLVAFQAIFPLHCLAMGLRIGYSRRIALHPGRASGQDGHGGYPNDGPADVSVHENDPLPLPLRAGKRLYSNSQSVITRSIAVKRKYDGNARVQLHLTPPSYG